MLFGFDIWFEIPSFTHPLEVVMLFGLVYGLKFLPLLTLLEVVMLFGPENSKVNTIATIYTFYWNLKIFKRITSLNYKCSRVWG